MSTTLYLIRQDPARGGLVRAIGTCLAAGLLLRMVPDIRDPIATLSADNLPGGFVPMYLLFTALVATFVLSANAWTRSSRLALGLPLSTRQMWAVRTGSLVAVALFSTVTLATAMGLSIDLEIRRIAMNPAIALAAARATVTVLVLIFLYQLPQSGRDRIPINPPYVVYIVGASLLTLVVSSTQIMSVAGTLVLLAIATGLATYLYRRIPLTFSVGPTIEESETPVWSMPDERDLSVSGPVDDETPADSGKVSNPGLHWILFRGLKTNILTWFLVTIVGISAAVVTLEFFKGTNALLALFFLVIYQVPLLQTALEGMPPFDPLPISRRILWAHSVAPIIVSTAVGAGIALTIVMLNPKPFGQITNSGCCVKVPLDYMALSRDGRVPAITTAWGESYTPTAHPVWRGRPWVVYDPFEIGAESSPRFANHQTRRAIDAVYGVPRASRTTNPDHEARQETVAGSELSASTVNDVCSRMSADRNRTAVVALIALALLTTVLMLTVLLQFGSSVHRKAFKRSSIGFIIVVIVLVVVVFWAQIVGMTEVWCFAAMISMGTRALAHALPFPTTILWFFCVTFWAGAYLLLERVFCTIEVPREKTMNRFAEEY